jgi:rRNA biogenesis protein RRP5
LNEGEYCHGLYLQCRVLSTSGTGPCEVSLRASRLEGDLENDLPPEEKEIVHAFVVNTNKKGCFLRLSRNIEGRVILKELSDSFLPDPVSMFPPGRLVVGKVKKISTTKDKRKKSSNKTIVDLDLRESVILEDQNKISFEDIKEGQKYRGIVTRIESYGVFVRLDNSDVSGLVHLSECSDDYIKNLSSLYDPGDLVKVLVIKINKEDRRIGLSMKASHFEDDESEDDESDSDDESDDENAAQMANFADDSDDSDDENYASKLAQKMKEMEDEDSNDDDSVSSDDDSSTDDSESEEDDDDAAPQAMDTNVGFDWGTTTEDNDMVYDNFKEFSTDESSSDEEEDDDDSDDDDDNAKKGHKSRKKATTKKHQEKEIAKMEQRLADGTADERPETSADFERLLASDPNSSENWIKYMAFHLSLADIESARAVANRAFDKIEFRQEGEKLNVWTALLTLENKYGTPKSFNDAIARASQHNNPKQVYLRVCEMLEKDVDNSHGDSGIVSRADEMFEKMCKKFKSKKTVWIAHFKYLLKSNRHEEAHELLKRSFKSLPEYKHVEAMSKFAQLEYEYGSQERARTIFDALLDKNRKRMDLLFVYVDKEIKHGEIEIARRIFEKVINPPSSSDKKKVAFSDKQMKSLFKKWYKIEDDHGDEKSKLRVKLAAKEYVEKSSKSK